jgi:2-polyprenyl-3-methyl-5-hydroxy-6-metoxy-1,4-benzoquinol methylase
MMRADPPLYLPDGYVENAPASADREDGGYWKDDLADSVLKDRALRWQEPVYRHAGRRFAARTRTVLDVGCGTGHKLVRHFGGRVERLVGLDQGSAIDRAGREFPEQTWIAGDLQDDQAWARAATHVPDLVICADVIEHVVDPIDLLGRVRAVSRGPVVLSTPDRGRLDDASPLGPPANPRHVREWTMRELQSFVRSQGFEIEQARHLLPRSYAPALVEVRRAAWRVLHRRAVPDPRSCSMLVLRNAPSMLT